MVRLGNSGRNLWHHSPKRIFMHYKSWMATLLLSGALLTAGCSKSDPVVPNPNITFLGTLSGANEVPANASTATGSVSVVFNSDTKILTATVTFSGLTPSAGHIHNAAAGVNGPVVFPLGSAPFSSPINYTSVALTAAQETDLMANNYYVNLHTAAIPGGEIRAQLIKQ
jgi:hypothetical protein